MADDEQDGLLIRRTGRGDVPAIVDLASRTLGWSGDRRDHDFFVWKHFENPFGESPGWAAFDGDRMVAFRTLMCWELVRGDERLRLVRAVDTATDPEYQGRGLFRRLTMQAVDELTAGGVDAVFNTPNDQSRPGYLKMGWEVLGRPTLWVQPSGPVTLVRMVRARVAAQKWSEPVSIGAPPDGLEEFAGDTDGWHTRLDADFLRWRFGFVPLRYRVVEVAGGGAIIRVRRRGHLREVAICAWLSPQRDGRAVHRMVREVGDYAVGVGLSAAAGFVPLRRQGPIVTWRPLASTAPVSLHDVSFQLGDLELF